MSSFGPSLLSYKCRLIFYGNEAKKIAKKKLPNGRFKKTEVFNHHQKLSNFHQNFTDWPLG